MVTDQQVLLLRRRIVEGKTQQASAATAGRSARSARRWRSSRRDLGIYLKECILAAVAVSRFDCVPDKLPPRVRVHRAERFQ